ncbi:hypothetical protein [Bradyrhizobium elkanii]|uniref:hypothetical protein n=1 Tax=Bradyrhizobium elkanii TaxID=29448 RepID=UPI001FDAB812|nr:hypothetical protein [Bradyrhizobium elkanii]
MIIVVDRLQQEMAQLRALREKVSDATGRSANTPLCARRLKHQKPMRNLTGKWHQLRADAKHCAELGVSTKDASQRALFKRLGDELAIEALVLERLVKRQTAHVDSE